MEVARPESGEGGGRGGWAVTNTVLYSRPIVTDDHN